MPQILTLTQLRLARYLQNILAEQGSLEEFEKVEMKMTRKEVTSYVAE